MKLRIYSDLHLEFGGFRPPNPSPDTVLVLAGDIGVKYSAMAFIEREAPKYKAVIYVLGNHEFYNGVLPTIQKRWKEYSHIPNLHVLENESVIIDGVKFCGATLWTDMKNDDWFVKERMARTMNDYHVIRTSLGGHGIGGYGRAHRLKDTWLTPSNTVAMHKQSVEWLKKEVTKNTVVVTHHAPLIQCINYERYGETDMNYAYFSNLENLIETNKPKVWISGHTHHSVDFKCHNTRIVSNARGYQGHELNPLFNPNKEIEV